MPSVPLPSAASLLAGLQGDEHESSVGNRGIILDGSELTAGLSRKQVCDQAEERAAQFPFLGKKKNKIEYVGVYYEIVQYTANMNDS